MNIDIVTIIESLRYIGLFFVLFAASGLFIGFLLPGDTILFTAGLLASQGYFDMAVLLLVLSGGAFIGDSFGYAVGSRFGHSFLVHHGLLFISHQELLKVQKFFERMGPKVMLFSRFLPGLGSFGPLIAGSVGMNKRLFSIYTAIGAVGWLSIFTFLGYFFGNSLSPVVVERYLFLIVVVIIILSLSPNFILNFYRKIKKH